MKNRICPSVVALILMVAGLVAPAAAQVAQNITPLLPPSGSDFVMPVAINDSGVVAAGVAGLPGVWLWKPVDGWQNTGGLGLWPSPVAINNSGQVAAYNLSTDGTHNEGLFYDPTSGWRLIDGFGNNGVVPSGMNDNGLVVGNSWLGSFIWTEADGPTILPALFRVTAVNNSGVVVGAAGFAASPTSGAAKWDATNGLILLHDGGNSSAIAINSQGVIAGYANGHATLWDATGVPLDLGVLGSYFDPYFCECQYEHSVAYAINDLGQVIGESTTSDGKEVAFIWDTTNGMRELFPFALYPFTRGLDINNNGQILAAYYDQVAGTYRGLLATVAPPAPPTPQGQTEVVADNVAALVASGELSAGDAKAIDKALDQAINALDRGNTTAAGNQLNAAVNKIKALVNSRRLSTAHGNTLTAALGTIIASL